MLFILIAILMVTGLYFFGIAIYRLWQIDWAATQPHFAVEAEESEGDQDAPRLTKLGRPITEIKLSA